MPHHVPPRSLLDRARASLGALVDELETPALLLEYRKLEQNIRTMSRFFTGRFAGLRPHFKTHKSPGIARMQVDAGAVGITCAKLGEAEVCVEAGLESILIANQVVGPQKLRRLAELNRRTRVMAAVDCMEHVEAAARAAEAAGVDVGLVVEVDVGLGRAGTRSADETLRLAAAVAGSRWLEFAGVMGYEGHAVFLASPEERRAASTRAMERLMEHVQALTGRGLAPAIVSAGGTGTYATTGSYPGVTEVQAGSYATMDARYGNLLAEFEPALTLLTTVVSRPEPARAVVDAGMKAVTMEFGLPVVIGVAGARVLGLSEEHGRLELEGASRELRVGDKIELLPSHGCTTINLHDLYYVVEGGRVIDVWPIAGRGRLD